MRNTQNEVAAMLFADCREKKNVAHSARARHTPGKGAKRAWSRTDKNGELSGPPVVYRMGRPLNWQAFTQTEPSILKNYLEMLWKRFAIGVEDLPEMVGARLPAVKTFLKNRGLGRAIPETHGDDWKAAEWQAFCDSLWKKEWSEADKQPIVAEVMTPPEQNDEAIRQECKELIETVCEEYGISVKELAARIGQPYSTVVSVRQGKVAAKRCQMYLEVIRRTEFGEKTEPALAQEEPVEEPMLEQRQQSVETTMLDRDAELEEMEKTPTEEGIISLKGPVPVVLAALRAMLGDSQEEVTITLRKRTYNM